MLPSNHPVSEYIKAGEAALAQSPHNAGLRRGLANLYLEVAEQLHRVNGEANTPEVSEIVVYHWKRATDLLPDEMTTDFARVYNLMAAHYHLLGNQKDCVDAIKKEVAIRQKLCQEHPLAALDARFLAPRVPILEAIGHMFNEPDSMVKEGLLGWRPPFIPLLLAPGNKIVNLAALTYWRKHICAITDRRLIRRLQPIASVLEYDTYWRPLTDGAVRCTWNRYPAIQEECRKRAIGPQISLTREHTIGGRKLLASLGVPPEAWYVTIHVRDQSRGKLGRNVDPKSTSNRDADIETYRLAMQAIVERGGWVIRLGDVSMKPLAPMKGVIDYVHSTAKRDWMDIFLVATSRFFLGTTSGVNGIPIAFNVPSILTNVSPMNGFPVNSSDLFIPKLLWFAQENRHLSFKDSLSPPFDYCFNQLTFERYGMQVQPNSPEEIRDVTIEMLDRFQGSQQYSEGDNSLQARFQSIVKTIEPYGMPCRIGRDFLRKHAHLLGPAPREHITPSGPNSITTTSVSAHPEDSLGQGLRVECERVSEAPASPMAHNTTLFGGTGFTNKPGLLA